MLEIGKPDSLGFVVGVADVIAHMRYFAAELTYSAHVPNSFREGRKDARSARLEKSLIAE